MAAYGMSILGARQPQPDADWSSALPLPYSCPMCGRFLLSKPPDEVARWFATRNATPNRPNKQPSGLRLHHALGKFTAWCAGALEIISKGREGGQGESRRASLRRGTKSCDGKTLPLFGPTPRIHAGIINRISSSSVLIHIHKRRWHVVTAGRRTVDHVTPAYAVRVSRLRVSRSHRRTHHGHRRCLIGLSQTTGLIHLKVLRGRARLDPVSTTAQQCDRTKQKQFRHFPTPPETIGVAFHCPFFVAR
jgi:hypothetical protein